MTQWLLLRDFKDMSNISEMFILLILYPHNAYHPFFLIQSDGGRNPSFDEKFQIPLVDGLRELNVLVWNSNTINNDDFIGSCRFVHRSAALLLITVIK